MSSILLGRQEATQTPVYLKEAARTRGMYILGAPGTGKSNLIELMILSDLQEGNGVFFLDPHGEAIDHIIKYVKTPQESSVIILDPEDEKYSFGINLLACRDLSSLKERTDTYTRAYNIFYKLWKNILDERPWLQLIVQNTLYALLENPGLTLAEMALFLTDENFRYHLANNIKYNSDVKDFWLNRFRQKRGSDQQRQADAALSRINTLLGQPYIRHIIGQTKTTIDFQQVLAGRKVVFLKLSAALSPDIKKFIGTIVISELLHAVRNRPEDQRGLFCVYIDEFQNFANSEDLAIFITEARKFAIATTIAHQERFGQLSDSKKMQGAILAAALKIYFQLIIKDAEELAGEFAREQPFEIKREREFVICQEPIPELIRGHRDPQIQAFVNKYLRTIRERLEDIKEDMEEARLKRMHFLDKAGIFELEGRMESAETRDYRSHLGYLGRKGRELVNAQAEGERLLDLFYERKNLRLTLRGLNIFLTALMEGRIAEGQEAFSDFLILLAGNIAVVPEQYIKVLGLYIRLSYGDNKTARAIPFEFSQKAGLFPAEVALLTDQTTRKTREKRTAFEEDYQKKEWASFHRSREYERDYLGKVEHIERKIVKLILLKELSKSALYEGFINDDEYIFGSERIYRLFSRLEKNQSLQDMLAPYYNARFNELWRRDVVWDLNGKISQIKWNFAKELKNYPDNYDGKTARRLNAFLEKYGEGALVTLALLNAPRYIDRGTNQYGYYRNSLKELFLKYWDESDSYCELARSLSRRMEELNHAKMEYRNRCMIDFPGIAGIEPLNVWRFVKKFNDFNMEAYRREDVAEWKKLFQESFNYFTYERPSAARTWNSCDLITREYLFTRACDLVRFGEDVADLTFPEPANSDYRWVVSSLVWLFDERQKQLAKEKDDEEEAEKRERIEKDCARQVGKIICRPPDALALRVLDAGGIRMVRETCISELMQAGEQTRKVIETIDNFVVFCRNLNKPENHLLIPSSQYTEKKVYTRSEADMKAEMAKELAGLSAFTAWVKRIDDSNMTVKNKTRIYNVAERFEYNKDDREILQRIIKKTQELYCTRRDLIEEEINKRQAKWRGSAPSPSVGKVPSQEAAGDSDKPGKLKPPPNRLPAENATTDEKARDSSGKPKPPPNNKPAGKVPDERARSKSGKPPPSSIPNPTAQDAKEPVKPKTGTNPGEGNLIYRSNFYQPDDKWAEGETDNDKLFRRDGYYHIELNNANTLMVSLAIPVFNFKVCVDAQLVKGGDKVVYGVCFRRIKDSNGLSCYQFIFNSGSYCLLLWRNGEYKFLLDYRSCEFIRQDSINSLMVQMRGQEITLGINEHILDTITDNSLTLPGYVGVSVSKPEDSLAEVRFRDFRLYSLEQ